MATADSGAVLAVPDSRLSVAVLAASYFGEFGDCFSHSRLRGGVDNVAFEFVGCSYLVAVLATLDSGGSTWVRCDHIGFGFGAGCVGFNFGNGGSSGLRLALGDMDDFGCGCGGFILSAASAAVDSAAAVLYSMGSTDAVT